MSTSYLITVVDMAVALSKIIQQGLHKTAVWGYFYKGMCFITIYGAVDIHGIVMDNAQISQAVKRFLRLTG